jgi:hypothetical protein
MFNLRKKSEDKEHQKHTKTTTTVKTNARVMGYGCSFFCRRVTDSDVFDPADSVNLQTPQPAISYEPTSVASDGVTTINP